MFTYMHKTLKSVLLAAIILAGSNAFAQNGDKAFKIEGTVLDANSGKPVPAVSVSSTETKRAVATDNEGHFSVKASSAEIRLLFSKDGYISSQVETYGRKKITVRLQEMSRTMRTEPEGIVAAPVNISRLNSAYMSLSDALTGRFSGLQVTNKSGMPGEGSVLSYRGIKTLYGSGTPLIVIDGVPVMTDENNSNITTGYSYDVLESANMNNIENVSVLSGVDALEYGALGSNGVIYIETQKGKVSRTAVEFQSIEGAALAVESIPMLSGMSYKRYIADIASGKYSSTSRISEAFPFLSASPSYRDNVKYGFDSDWQKMISTPALQSNNMLKVRGGDAIVQYMVTAGYQYQNGVVDGTSKNKFSTAGNTDINFSDKLKAFASVAFDFVENHIQEQGLVEQTNPLLASYASSPLTGAYEVDANGGILKEYAAIDQAIGVSNPVSMLENIEAKNKIYDFLVNVGVKYSILPHLKADAKFGITYKYIKDDIFIGGKSTSSIAPLMDGIALNTVRSGASESRNYYGGLRVAYDLDRKGHNLNASAGFQVLSLGYNASSGSGINTSTDRYRTLSNVSSTERQTGGYEEVQHWMNAYAKADYNYRSQLFATLIGQVGRSSSYGAYSQGWFVSPAARLGWKISSLPGMCSSNTVSNLMLRAEYSVNPNARYSNALSSYYYKLKLYKDVSGLVRAGIPNEKLGPENVRTADAGLDFSLFGDKLTLRADAYCQTTYDMIVASEISGEYGYTSKYTNDGRMRTVGGELALSAVLIDKGFQWRIGGNIARSKAKILSLGGRDEIILDYGDGVNVINRVNDAPFSYYGFKTDGVYSTSAEAKSDGLYTTGGYHFTGGDMRFADINGDGVLSYKDKVNLGSATPDFYGGFYSNMSWKGFKLFANFSYSYGSKLYNAVRRFNESGFDFHNQSASMDRRWVSEGQVTDIPRAVYGDPAGNSRFSDRWIEDGSYIKLKELTLSWEKNGKFLFMNGFKVYVTGENLLCFTRYTGSDPEFAYSYEMATAGMDLAKVPVPRFLKLGIVLNL